MLMLILYKLKRKKGFCLQYVQCSHTSALALQELLFRECEEHCHHDFVELSLKKTVPIFIVIKDHIKQTVFVICTSICRAIFFFFFTYFQSTISRNSST